MYMNGIHASTTRDTTAARTKVCTCARALDVLFLKDVPTLYEDASDVSSDTTMHACAEH
jgi:hypothetical protein